MNTQLMPHWWERYDDEEKGNESWLMRTIIIQKEEKRTWSYGGVSLKEDWENRQKKDGGLAVVTRKERRGEMIRGEHVMQLCMPDCTC